MGPRGALLLSHISMFLVQSFACVAVGVAFGLVLLAGFSHFVLQVRYRDADMSIFKHLSTSVIDILIYLVLA
jgi:hypothetical protein